MKANVHFWKSNGSRLLRRRPQKKVSLLVTYFQVFVTLLAIRAELP